MFKVEYSPELVSRLKSWLEDDERFHFEVDRFLEDKRFVSALKNIASEYAKKEWRFRNNKQINDINGIKYSSTQHEQVPVGETDRYYTRRFIASWPSAGSNRHYPGYSYYRTYLLAGDESVVGDPRYPVHQAVGIASTALVLSVVVDFYAVDSGLRSDNRVNSSRSFYWVVLPSWKK